ncbi:MAG TPA: DUF4349 domain-containing protein [Thermoanaerobaculia bacterium]|nr:DUF4349 domain-containing protein [Thermoanaerobaculia bacterium]
MKKLILMLVLVVACSRSESVAGIASTAPPRPQADTSARSIVQPAAPARDTPGVAVGVAALQTESEVPAAPAAPAIPRMIVRTADVRIIVADTSKTVDAVTKSVEGAGGYVSGSNIWREGELLRAKLTLRVPADKLTSTLASIRAQAKRVETETIASEDVSQEFVDLDSQVRNLEATEGELLELLKVARVNSKRATDVLEVHEQLTVIRGQIEQARGRMRYLSQVTSMSAVALDIVPDAIAQPIVKKGWQPFVVVKDASRALVDLLQNIATVAIWFVIYVVPVLGMLFLLIYAMVKASRKSRAREA